MLFVQEFVKHELIAKNGKKKLAPLGSKLKGGIA
jgi:hypothetical protein